MKWAIFTALKLLDDHKEKTAVRERYYAQKQEEREANAQIEREKKQNFLNGFYQDYDKVKK